MNDICIHTHLKIILYIYIKLIPSELKAET